MVVYFDWKTVIYIYVCGKCRIQFMLPMEMWVTFTGACANVFARRKTNSHVDNLMFILYECNNCLLYRNYSKMFMNMNILFCRRKQNNFRYIKYNYGKGLKEIWIFKTLPVNRGCRPGYNMHFIDRVTAYCFPLHYKCLSCSPRCLPRPIIFRKNYFNIVKYYAMYNNIFYLHILFDDQTQNNISVLDNLKKNSHISSWNTFVLWVDYFHRLSCRK